MKVFPRRPVNLHSESMAGGLVHCEADTVTIVPDDVKNHPLFNGLVDSGFLTVVTGDEPATVGQTPYAHGEPLHSPDDEDLESKNLDDDPRGPGNARGEKVAAQRLQGALAGLKPPHIGKPEEPAKTEPQKQTEKKSEDKPKIEDKSKSADKSQQK